LAIQRTRCITGLTYIGVINSITLAALEVCLQLLQSTKSDNSSITGNNTTTVLANYSESPLLGLGLVELGLWLGLELVDLRHSGRKSPLLLLPGSD